MTGRLNPEFSKIKVAESEREKAKLDHLLWEVLWAHLAFPRDIRRSFALDNNPVEFVAANNGNIIGGLVADRIGQNAIELRHIAVAPDHQRRSIGSGLVQALVDFARKERVDKIQAYARNTSLGFFLRNSFAPTGEKLKHPDFERHGITFRKVVLNMEHD